MYSEKLGTTQARQIAITSVDKGSPAEGLLKVGDVILGVSGKAFSYDPRTEFGKALTFAESEAGQGDLVLMRWRDGETTSITVNIPVLGSYSPTAPYDCPKSKRILEQGCDALAKRIADPGYKTNPISRSLNALALLASGEEQYLPLIRQEAQWAAEYTTNGYKSWSYGYVITLLAEYVIATGDQSVMPGLKRLALEAAHGQSAVGSWGHRFAQEDGRLGGYGMMNAPGIPLTYALVLARTAGVDDPVLSQAIERSLRLLRFYTGKGAIPYGDHSPWMQTHEDNGKCGMAAVLFQEVGERDAAEFFSRMSVASHGPERDTGHTGNFFNLLWAMPGVALSGPNASGAWMDEFGAWYFDLARRWDGTYLHQGPPDTRKDKYAGWDVTGAYLLAYAMPLKKIHLTGKNPGIVPKLSVEEAEGLIEDGRGWSNQDRNSFYDGLDESELFSRLESWSPIVRERAAMALARRKLDATAKLIEMLASERLVCRLGACQALAQLKRAAAPAVPALRENLSHEDLWLRITAAEALAAIGEPAMEALPDLLQRLASKPSEDDPRGMEQRYLCFVVFGQMLRHSPEKVDPALLRDAVAAGLQNEDGRARGSVSRIYSQLSFGEIKPLLPAIHQAIIEPAPSGIMFASGVRLAGIELLAKHRIKEGMALSLDVMEIDKWGKQQRIKRGLSALEKYGAAAKPLLPQLRELEADLKAHREARNLKREIDQLRQLIQKLEGASEPVELRSLK